MELDEMIFLGACSILGSVPLPEDLTEDLLYGHTLSSKMEIAVKLARRTWQETRRSLREDDL